jgi:hypothetical protein
MGRERNPSGLVLPTVTPENPATFGLEDGCMRRGVGPSPARQQDAFAMNTALQRNIPALSIRLRFERL